MQDQSVSEPGIQVTKPLPQRDRSGKKAEVIVTHTWTVAEIVGQYPQATEVMAEYGLHCFGCAVSSIETLEEGCQGHGFSEEDIDNLVEDINHVIASTPARPQTLGITKEAALGIRKIAEAEHPSGGASSSIGLSVQANADGSFFMEFRESMEEGEKEFGCKDVPDVKIWASILTLQRVGGATVTLKEGKFKLEVESSAECCGEKEEGCGCK